MVTRRRRWLWSMAAALWLPLAALAQPAPVTELFQRAEAIRTADPAAFGGLVDALATRSREFSTTQREQFAYLQAYRLAFSGNYDAVIPRLEKLSTSSPDSDVRFRAGALLINIYTKSRRFTEGLRQLGDTLVHIDKVSDPQLRIHALTEAAYIHNEVGQYRLGMHYAERILEGEPDARSRCFAEFLRYDAMLNLALMPSEDRPLVEAIDHCSERGENLVANHIRVTLARKWVGERKRSEAIALLRSHLPEVEAIRYPYLAVLFKATLAELMLEKGDVHAAESFATETVALSGSVGNTYALVSAYRTLYRVAERRRDDETALVFYRRYAEADKAYLNEVKARELAYQIVRQETLEKSQQIQRLDSQNQVLQLQRRLEAESSQNTRLVVVLLAMLLASIVFWAFRTKRTQMSFKRLAQTDALTGMGNRSHFTDQAERALANAARNGEEAALIMFDLDHFKMVNDRYGHAVGDWVLQHVAEVCKRAGRRGDILGRLGGEEFALLLPACDLRAAAGIAEECRARIADLDTEDSGHRFLVTASFGVASTALGGYTLARLLSITDHMLYRSKHEGRDRVTAYEGGYGSIVDYPGPMVAAAEAEPGRTPSRESIGRLGA